MRFKYTTEGNRQAKEYLKSIGKYHIVSREDGFSIVTFANSLYNKESKGEKIFRVK